MLLMLKTQKIEDQIDYNENMGPNESVAVSCANHNSLEK